MDEAEIKKRNRELISNIVNRNLQGVEISLNNGADVDSKTDKGSNALRIAINIHYGIDIVKLLVTRGADINAFDEFVQDTPLIFSIRNYNKNEIAKYLISIGANVCKKGKDGKTPLQWAVQENNLQLTELLLDHGADITIHGAFYEAICVGNLEIITLLLKKGADVNLLYRNGYTPLLKAIELKKLDIVKKLIENGADINIKDHYGNSPLLKAVKVANYDLVKLILEYKGNVDEKDQKGNYPLMIAIKTRNLEIVRLLIEHGANLEIRDSDGNSPFYKALLSQHFEMVKYFVERGEDVNKVDTNGHTPLSIAAELSDFRTFRFLVEAGAKIENSLEKIRKIAEENEDFDFYLKSLTECNVKSTGLQGCQGQEDASL